MYMNSIIIIKMVNIFIKYDGSYFNIKSLCYVQGKK